MPSKTRKKAPPKRKVGRPSIYSLDLAIEIATRLMSGEALRRICLDDKMPAEKTVFWWLAGRGIEPDQHTEFVQLYARAREVQAELMIDDMLDISDDITNDIIEVIDADGNTSWVPNHAAVHRARLKVDTRKFITTKVLPKFADKMVLEGGDKPIEIQSMSNYDAARRLMFILAKARKEKANQERIKKETKDG